MLFKFIKRKANCRKKTAVNSFFVFFIKILFYFSFFLLLIPINTIFCVEKRISFLIFNPFNKNLLNWQGKIYFTFDELNISSCVEVERNNSYLTTSFNEILPFVPYCDNSSRKVYLIYQLPFFPPLSIQKIFYYYNKPNKIYLEINFSSINVSCYNVGSGSFLSRECKAVISFPFPSLYFNYYRIYLNYVLNRPTEILSSIRVTLNIDKCISFINFLPSSTSLENSTNFLEECVNRRISKKKPIKINVIFSNLPSTVNVENIINSIREFTLKFYYPTPFYWGIGYKNGRFFTNFYYLDTSNYKNYIEIGDDEGKLLIFNTSASYFGIYLKNKNLIPNSLEELRPEDLIFVRISNITDSLFNNSPSLIDEASRTVIFTEENHSNENFFNLFNIRAFDSWIRMFFKNNEYYKTKKKIYVKNPYNFSYSYVILPLKVNKSIFRCYYYYCNDLELFYNDSGIIKPLKYRLKNCNDFVCNFDVLIPYLGANSTFVILSYSNNKYSFLNKSVPFNLSEEIYLSPSEGIATSISDDFSLPDKLSKNFFKFVFEVPDIDKVYYSYYLPSAESELKFDKLNDYIQFNNSEEKILNDLLLFYKKDRGVLLNFNRYIGLYNETLLRKGEKNWKLEINITTKKIILEGQNAYLPDILFSFAPINFVNSSKIEEVENNYYLENLSFDVDNAEKIGDYIKESYVFLRNNLNISFYPLFSPSFIVVNNTKQVALDSGNAKVGVTSYNLFWRDKTKYSFLSTYYPVITRKGSGIYWKVFSGYHIYTNNIVYYLVHYSVFYKNICDLSFYLQNQDLTIVK